MPYPPFASVENSYTAHQQAQGDNSFPGQQIDTDLANLKEAVDTLNQFVRGVTRSDGEVGNQTIGYDQLKPELSIGLQPPATWAAETRYEAGATVFTGLGYYRATADHTSSVSFSADLGTGLWELLIDFESSLSEELPAVVAPIVEGMAPGVVADALAQVPAVVTPMLDALPPVYLDDRSSIKTIIAGDDDPGWLYDEFPPSSNHGNTLFGSGIVDTGDLHTVRVSAFGSMVLTKSEHADRVSVFGMGSLRHTKFAERVDVFGTINCQWGGANLSEDATGDFYHHDLIYNGGGARLVEGTPGSYTLNAAWTASNLYNLSGTVGQSIVDWLNTDPWPTTSTDFAYIQAFGRDALCEIVKGENDVAFGYRALALLLEGDDNTAVGNNALFRMVFGDQNTAIGKSAGFAHRTGNANTYVGRNAGYSHDEGVGSVFFGNNSGNGAGGTFKADWSVFIGRDAGVNPDGTINADLSNRLFIQDDDARGPLINGDFANATIGINLPIATTAKGRLHVYSASSGQATPQSGGTEAVLEGSGHSGLSILSGAASNGSVYFADSGSALAGYVQYNHASDYLRFGVNGSEKVRFKSNTVNITSLPTSASGLVAGDLWNDGGTVKVA